MLSTASQYAILSRNTGCDLTASHFACGRRCIQPDIDLQQAKTSLDSKCVSALATLTLNPPDLPALGRDGQTNAFAGDDATCVAPALRGLTA